DDTGNRARKVWQLIAYMIYHRHRSIPKEELYALLGGGEEDQGNLKSALRTILHRARLMLNQLGETAGHDLLIRQGEGYAWNNDFPIEVDTEVFDSQCSLALSVEDKAQRLYIYLAALDLYKGDFLSKFSGEAWVIPLNTYFHHLYLGAVSEAVAMLEEQRQHELAISLCRQALKTEPYSEQLYWHLMRNLLDSGDQKGVVATYEEMSQIFFDNFGILPDESVRALYYEANRSVSHQALPLEAVMEQLREAGDREGAMVCEWDFFRVLYNAMARMALRNGDAVHLAQISLVPKEDKPLARRSLDRAMINLQDQIRVNLRRGDTISRCSISQFVILLPQANYEDSCAVCERINRSFVRHYPHSPAELKYAVQPLEVAE
ncbi:MAG: hypothetical protein IJF59_01125, partial [Clostridia bacterium]|nr:hypothetical protein [Clostridia bacterium]